MFTCVKYFVFIVNLHYNVVRNSIHMDVTCHGPTPTSMREEVWREIFHTETSAYTLVRRDCRLEAHRIQWVLSKNGDVRVCVMSRDSKCVKRSLLRNCCVSTVIVEQRIAMYCVDNCWAESGSYTHLQSMFSCRSLFMWGFTTNIASLSYLFEVVYLQIYRFHSHAVINQANTY